MLTGCFVDSVATTNNPTKSRPQTQHCSRHLESPSQPSPLSQNALTGLICIEWCHVDELRSLEILRTAASDYPAIEAVLVLYESAQQEHFFGEVH